MFLSWLWKSKTPRGTIYVGTTPAADRGVGRVMGNNPLSDEELATSYVREDDAGNYNQAELHEKEFFRRRRASNEDEDDATHAWCKLIDLVDARLKEIKPS